MKKSFIYSAMLVVLCLFAACSQEEIVSQSDAQSKVTLQVRVPNANPVTRSLDVAGYQLRCIMEMIDGDGNVVDDSRQVSAVTNGNATFEIDKTLAAEGKCLFWADYVEANAENLETDKFYKTTSNLTKIDYKLNKSNDLFNNAAMDAFCGTLDVATASASSTVTLKRPFIRLAITKEDLAKMVEDANQATISLNVGSEFNVNGGTTTTQKTLGNTVTGSVASPLTIDANVDYPFFCYIFPVNDEVTKVSTIKLAKDSGEPKTITITAENQKKMKPNYSFNLQPKEEGGEGGDDTQIEITIEIDGSWNQEGTTDPDTDPEQPTGTLKVGDYIKADGTVATTASEAVAVVYALASELIGNDDAIADYEVSNKSIAAYAVALENAYNTRKMLKGTADFPTVTETTNFATTFKGYSVSKTLLETTLKGYDSPAFDEFKTWKESKTLTGANLSGWYIPSFKQLTTITDLITSDTNFAAKVPLSGFNSTATGWYCFSCCVNATPQFSSVTITGGDDPTVKSGQADQSKAQGIIRPVLTIFADAAAQ